jgi:hypothetical protein
MKARTTMKNGVASLTLLLIAAIAGGSAHAQQEPAAAPATRCQLKHVGSADLIFSDSGLQVPVTLAGHSQRMFLEFGTFPSLIKRKAALAAGLTPKKLRRTGGLHIEGKPVKDFVAAEGLHIGTAPLGKLEMLVQDAPGQDATVAGSITLDYATVDIELDFAHSKLHLFSPDHCPGNVVYWTDQYSAMPFDIRHGSLYFDASLNGRKIQTAFFPASPSSWTFSDVTRRLFGFDEFSPGMQVDTKYNGGDAPRVFFRAMKLEAPGLEVKNSRVQIRSRAGCPLIEKAGKSVSFDVRCQLFPLYLGQNVLRELRIYIAVKEGMLYYSAAHATLSSPKAAEVPAP